MDDGLTRKLSAFSVISRDLGIVSSYTLGGFIHLLLVVAVITILIRLIQGGVRREGSSEQLGVIYGL